MELRYFQIKIWNETKRVHIPREGDVLGYMYLNGKPSKGNPPIQKVLGNSSLKDFYSASPDLGSRKIVSSRVKSLFEDFSKGRFIYLKCPIQKVSDIIDSYWITDVINFDDLDVDFKNSRFQLYEGRVIKEESGRASEFDRKLSEVSFRNLDELEELEKNLNHLSYVIARTLKIKETCERPLLFLRSFGIFDLIVSEELKSEIQKQKMDKGIEFKPLDISDEEWYGPNGLRKQFYK
ncbi:hypothetical protein [Algoriphagus namhaensis]